MGLEEKDFGGKGEGFGVERGPEETREDLGVEDLGGVEGENGVIFVDDSVGAPGFVDVFQHYFTCLERAVTKTNF